MKISNILNVDKQTYSLFNCGNAELNTFLYYYAKQNSEKNLGKTFVLEEKGWVIGYYTLSSAQISFSEENITLYNRLPRYPIPCIRIARLAIDKKHQGKHYGAFLLKDAFTKIIEVSKVVGIYFVIVDAKKESKSFYEKYGFTCIDKERLTYALSVKKLNKAI